MFYKHVISVVPILRSALTRGIALGNFKLRDKSKILMSL